MSGDYSRIRFTPQRDVSGVLMQQGRVQLDSDWNEWVEALDRRLRAETVDILGVHPPTGIESVAVVPAQTPDGFKIEVTGGALSIGRGRMYVNGLLAENHGGGTPEFDPVLAELRGQSALAYHQQPYHPNPPALPTAGSHLAYLEVWQREVTHIEQPDLVEPALGVDTTTRMQTVWQVRLHAGIGNAGCETPDASVPGWPAVIAPSAGRMSSRAVGVPPGTDPCELQPGGGYRGLENQLYRIEIHDGGGIGQATFKWSRDNASVSSLVSEIVSSTELRLESLGRDAVLRFSTGDWVEITDDWRELSGETGNPALRRGVMRRVTVDDAKRTISFTPALPADLIPSGVGDNTLEKRHLRARRWDQKGMVRDDANNLITNLDLAGSSGLIPINAAGVWINIEHGVQVRFDAMAANTGMRSGDHWVIYARSATAKADEFTSAPPRGIHRHYARLAIVNFPDGEDDCRIHWPPSCGGCCTVVVAPGESIQAAIDSLPAEGGCVCLKTGVHDIAAPLTIATSRVILRGESPGTIVRGTSLAAMLQIGGAAAMTSDIAVEGIRFEALGTPANGGALLFLTQCARVRVEHCELAADLQQLPMYAGAWIDDSSEIDITGNRLLNLMYGVWIKDCRPRLHITRNLFTGLTYDLFGNDKFSAGQAGVYVDNNAAADVLIEDNRFVHFWTAAYLNRGALGSQVLNNRILRSAATIPGNPPTNTDELRAYLDLQPYAIVIEAARCVVRGNYIDLRAAAWGGIRVTGADVTIAENTLEAVNDKMGDLRPTPIYCLPSASQGLAADHALIQDNRVFGQHTGIVISRIDGAQIERNHIDGATTSWYGLRIDDCTDSVLQDNVINACYFGIFLDNGERNRVVGNQQEFSFAGIMSLQETGLEVTHNTVRSALVGGITLYANGATVLHNRVFNCGYFGPLSIGIAVISLDALTAADSGAMVRIEGCEVVDTGISADGSMATSLAAIGLGGGMVACQILHNRVGYTQPDLLDPQKEHRALTLIGPLGLHYDFGSTSVEYMVGSAQISANHFRGPGKSALVELVRVTYSPNIDSRFEKVMFSNNICDHLGAAEETNVATVRLWGGHLIAMGNHVKAPVGVSSMSLGNRHRVALMGNVTTGGYINVGTVTPAPINNFNVLI